jgi:NTE family protein
VAHIGAIRWLTENDYLIQSISGASVGALVGGCHAAGKLDALANWMIGFEKLTVLRLLDPTFGRAGLFSGERIVARLREMIGDITIEDLPLAFTAVATELESGAEVWIRRGKVVDAIRASMATPLVFTPFDDGERKLLDGGLVDPVPIAPTLDDKTDLTVAVDVFGAADPEGCPWIPPAGGMVSVAMAAMDAMQNTIARLRLQTSSPDVLVEIPRTACGFHEFWRAEELIEMGRKRTAAAFEAVREVAKAQAAKAQAA